MKKNGKIINTILLAAFAAIIAVTSLTSQNIGLNTTVSASSARVRVNATRYVNVPNGSTLNLRSGAGMGHTVIGSIPRGTALHIPYAEGNWAYTSYNGKYGWVSLDYISVSKPSTTPTLPTPTPSPTPPTPTPPAPPTNPNTGTVGPNSNRIQWLKNLIGKPAVEWGNSPGTQCVELPKWYAEQISGKSNRYVGLGNGDTNAKGIADFHGWNYSSNKSDIKPGDVVSFVGTSTNGFSLPYGHVVIVYEVSGNTFKYIDQWAGSGTIRTGTATVGRSDITGRARPPASS